jgi:hypothetical protein
MAGKTAWNRGRTLSELYDEATTQRLRESFRSAAYRAHRTQAILRELWPERETARREKISATARRVGLGGYRHGSGIGRQGRYQGIWCDSSYELAFVIYALDHGFTFERNWQSFPYTFRGVLRRWMPDFRLSGGRYLEIKGYISEQVQAKFAAFPHPLIIVQKRNLQFVFDYVVGKYGKDFRRYE